MNKLFFLLSILLSTSVSAIELKIGVSDSNLGGISQATIKSILSCTTNLSESNISIKTFPSLRGKQELLDRSVDGYYPVLFESLKRNTGLFPLYIDEVLLIKLKGTPRKNLSLGLVRGDNSHYLKKFNDYSVSFSVLNSETLFKGLTEKRAEAIIVKRSDIPTDFNLSEYDLESLEYLESGIELNTSFYKKVAKGKVEIKKKYSQCLERVNFLLDHDRREIISKRILSDIKSIQENFSLEREVVKGIEKKEKLWQSDSKGIDLKKSTLSSLYSEKLKKNLSHFGYITEAFVFNYQGAVLGAFSATSDFDQSDEEKYRIVKSSKNFDINNITNLYYDSSSGSFQVGIMIRLEDKKRNFSGGIYIGANINKLLTHYKIK